MRGVFVTDPIPRKILTPSIYEHYLIFEKITQNPRIPGMLKFPKMKKKNAKNQ